MESGGTLSDIYASTRRLLLRARDGIEKLERLESSSSSASSFSSSSSSAAALAGADPPPELAFSVRRDIGQIQTLCADMDRLWRSIASKGQRDLWRRIGLFGTDSKTTLFLDLAREGDSSVNSFPWFNPFRKVELVAEEVESLKESLDKLSLRQQKRMLEAKERAALLERANGESAHVLRIFDEEAQAIQSAQNSHVMLEEAYATGVAVLSKYAEQRDRLKRAQRKALDILNTVGLSNSVLKLIERRHRVDKWIAYAGMVTTVFVVFIFWRWTH